jgi:hypothetical protein
MATRARRRKPIWSATNLYSSEGAEPLQRRGPGQQDEWVDVDPQPEVMIVVTDEADPHANQRDSFSGQYGVLYVLRTDEVKDKDRFWFSPPNGQRFVWGIVGDARWNIDHALTGINYGVKMFRIRRGG